MLNTLGIHSKVTLCREERTTLLPDGKGGKKEYDCKEIYRLLVSSYELYKLSQLGFKPKAYIRSWAYVGVDPFEELLLGPTFATNKVLNDMKLKLSDIGVVEFHEAFAGQVLANMAACASDKFGLERLGGKPIGKFDMSKTNTLGGSLSLGHPFGATGSRLVTTASNRLQREQQRFALITACADGGLAHACILERYPNK